MRERRSSMSPNGTNRNIPTAILAHHRDGPSLLDRKPKGSGDIGQQGLDVIDIRDDPPYGHRHYPNRGSRQWSWQPQCAVGHRLSISDTLQSRFPSWIVVHRPRGVNAMIFSRIRSSSSFEAFLRAVHGVSRRLWPCVGCSNAGAEASDLLRLESRPSDRLGVLDACHCGGK